MTRPDPFAGLPTHALRPWTDAPPDDPAPTPRPRVTVGPLDVDGLRELLGRPIRGIFGGWYCPLCAGVIWTRGTDGPLCRCRVIGEGAA